MAVCKTLSFLSFLNYERWLFSHCIYYGWGARGEEVVVVAAAKDEIKLFRYMILCRTLYVSGCSTIREWVAYERNRHIMPYNPGSGNGIVLLLLLLPWELIKRIHNL